jgi:hypothetical protein
MEAVERVVDKIVGIGLLENKKTIFLIGNTAKKENLEFYLSPIRVYDQIIVAGVIVFSERMAKKIAKYIDGLIDYIFIDSEKKIRDESSVSTTLGNMQRAVRQVVFRSELISYKANDLTVDAADIFISEYYSGDIAALGGKKVAIIGAGNIGSKIALKLVERGADVRLYRRDVRRLNFTVDYINSVKSKYTVASAFSAMSVMDASLNADVLIGLTNGVPIIDDNVISSINSNSLIIDIGKGSISKSAVMKAYLLGLEVYRLSVESALEGMIVSSISTHNIYKKRTGRSIWNNTKIVSGSILAHEDEFVVDDYSNPRVVYGLGDGMGDFKRILNKKEKDSLNFLTMTIENNG